jgi:putative nucleotidyltransferase with HDIG domain
MQQTKAFLKFLVSKSDLMKNSVSKFSAYYPLVSKIILFAIAVVIIVFILPGETRFRYDFQRGKPWVYEDLIAPFSFSVHKSKEKLNEEREALKSNAPLYFVSDPVMDSMNRLRFIREFNKSWDVDFTENAQNMDRFAALSYALGLFDTVFHAGLIEMRPELRENSTLKQLYVRSGADMREKDANSFFSIQTADAYFRKQLKNFDPVLQSFMLARLQNALVHNVLYDDVYTQKELSQRINNMSLTTGMVQVGERIISKGELVTNNKYQLLDSLRLEYDRNIGGKLTARLVLLGKILLVLIAISGLAFYLYFFRRDVFEENERLVLILTIILLMVFMSSVLVKTNPELVYLLPLCMAPILIRIFFDSRLAFFIHFIIIFIVAYTVPNSFEFAFVQMFSGLVTIFSFVSLRRRAQFFITSLWVFLAYAITYSGLHLIRDGSLAGIDSMHYAYFAGAAFLILFTYPLIFLFEKVFGMITDITLLELSDTNNKLLRELSNKAPGTFQHSLQVANMAEEAIRAIDGNPLLVRAGALYHDIGKIDSPLFFVENQVAGLNPHEDLSPIESADVIIGHVIKGVEMAKKNKLPEQIIDFIRTHHGTRKTDYFYFQYRNENPGMEIDEDAFRYHGPAPFSKETAVLMMADSVEAASRSIKQPNEENLDNLVEKIIQKQVEENQFDNADITLKDISIVKKILKHKLMNIYHLRIEYPS